jgi:Fic family protein
MGSNLNQVIERIDKLMLEVDSYRPLKPEQEQRLLQKIRLDWNFHSSHIEGNSLTYSETKSFLLWHITADGKPFRDYLEMKGHNEAVEYILDTLKGTEISLTEHLIRHLHKTILHEEFEADAVTPDGKPTKRIIKPGDYKSLPNHVKTKSGSMFYFASPEDTPSQMYDLMTWLNKEISEKKSHPLIIASLFHYKFVRIHPFDDGNGRMSRLLMNLILMKFGLPPVIIPYEIKDNYYNALQFADAEDIDKFVIFIGERLIEALNQFIKVGKNEPLEVEYSPEELMQIIKKKL